MERLGGLILDQKRRTCSVFAPVVLPRPPLAPAALSLSFFRLQFRQSKSHSVLAYVL
jgi:hypothetical protein